MKRFLRGLLWGLVIMLGFSLVLIIVFNSSPKPGAWVIRHMFSSEFQVTDQKNYQRAKQEVSLVKDKSYASKHNDNSFDVYYPKKSTGALPVLIWVHGGGFVAGDKKGTREFATRLANDTNIAVLSMNYETAPESTYPNQIIQVGELINCLKIKKYKMLDLSQILFGGDSAGSQIALQYVLTQTNSNYGRRVGIKQGLNKTAIKGTISYCGPVNLKQMVNVQSNSQFMKFFVNTVAWSEIGTRNWKNSSKLEEVSLVSHLTSNFPATYITDGNAFSFQDQGIEFKKRLEELNIPVQALFFKNYNKTINHEYQFDYSLDESQKCYKETLEFINKLIDD